MKPRPRQLLTPFLVILRLISMLRAIKFDDQLSLKSDKIKGVPLEVVLPAELHAGDLPITKCPP